MIFAARRVPVYAPLIWRLTVAVLLLGAALIIRTAGDAPLAGVDFPLRRFLYSFVVAWPAAFSILVLVGRAGQAEFIATAVAGAPPHVGWGLAFVALIVPIAWPALLEPLAAAGVPLAAIEILQVLFAALAAMSLLLMLIPRRIWSEVLRSSAPLALLAAAMALIAVTTMHESERLWDRTTGITFQLVSLVLRPFYPHLQADAGTRILDAGGVQIFIAEACSGLEGVGLMVVFGLGWLWFLRREFRFPHALLLVPAGMLVIFLLNAVRIAALFALAEQGHVEVALAGFHSQAGWIFFNATVFLVALVSRNLAWFRRGENMMVAAPAATLDAVNPTTAYLLPMLVLLATGMLTGALAAGFDHLYGLRIVTAGAVFYWYRHAYRNLDWRCGWQGLAAGLCVFLVWLIASQWLSEPRGMPAQLQEASAWQRSGWIILRTLVASLLVPAAEELAFRGFLMRRIDTPGFDTSSFARTSITALLVSSILFGLTHGSYWAPGTFAGLLFGIVAIRTGRFGDALLAHAVANAMLAATVLIYGKWELW